MDFHPYREVMRYSIIISSCEAPRLVRPKGAGDLYNESKLGWICNITCLSTAGLLQRCMCPLKLGSNSCRSCLKFIFFKSKALCMNYASCYPSAISLHLVQSLINGSSVLHQAGQGTSLLIYGVTVLCKDVSLETYHNLIFCSQE